MIRIATVFLAFFISLQAQPPSPVKVAGVQLQEGVKFEEFVGSVFYKKKADLSIDSAGSVVALGFTEGARVAPGQELVLLDSRVLENRIEVKEAQIASMEFELESLERDFRRLEALYESDSIPKKRFEDSRLKYSALNASLNAAKAELKGLLIELDKKRLSAPFAGVVIDKNVEVGEWVSASSKMLRLADDDWLEVVVSIPQHRLGGLEGKSLSVAIGQKRVEAKVNTVIKEGDIKSRSFPLKLDLPRLKGVYEGMEANVYLPAIKKGTSLSVPRDAILSNEGRTFVYTIKEGKATPAPVKIEGYVQNRALISSPVLNGESEIIIEGQERLRPNQPVRAVNRGS